MRIRRRLAAAAVSVLVAVATIVALGSPASAADKLATQTYPYVSRVSRTYQTETLNWDRTADPYCDSGAWMLMNATWDLGAVETGRIYIKSITMRFWSARPLELSTTIIITGSGQQWTIGYGDGPSVPGATTIRSYPVNAWAATGQELRVAKYVGVPPGAGEPGFCGKKVSGSPFQFYLRPGSPTPYFQLLNSHSYKCLHVSGASVTNGFKVLQFGCDYSANPARPYNESWYLQPVHGYYHIVNEHSGKCLVMSAASTTNGGIAVQWTCESSAPYNEEWSLVNYTGFGNYHIVNRHSGKCLTISAASEADGAVAVQWTCESNYPYNEDWQILPF